VTISVVTAGIARTPRPQNRQFDMAACEFNVEATGPLSAPTGLPVVR